MRVYLRYDRYTGVEPGTTTVYADRTSGGLWEDVELTRQADGLYLARYTAANRVLSIQPDGRLETRPAGTDGLWERLTAAGTDNPLVGVLTRVSDGVVIGRPLTIESADGQPLHFGGDSHGGGGESGFLHMESRTLQNQNEGGTLHRSEIVDERGQPWCLIGYAVHTLISSIARGVDVRPILRDAKSFGANAILGLGCHLSPWKFEHGYDYDPRRPDHAEILAATFDVCADEGLRLYHGAFADCQYGVTLDQQRRIWRVTCDVAHGRWNAIVKIGNEWPVNGWYPFDFDKPTDTGGVLYSRGSVGIDGQTPAIPISPYWDIAEFSSRRDAPQNKSMIDAGCYELYAGGWDANPHGFTCALVNIEPPILNATNPDRNGDTGRWTNRDYARILGASIGAQCSGGVAHATDGMECLPLDPVTADLVRAFCGGMRGAFYGGR